MTITTRAAWTLCAMTLTAMVSMAAQAPAPAAQRNLDPAVVRTGAGLFRERCAECHGAYAKGVAAHDLTQLWASGASDDRGEVLPTTLIWGESV